MRKEAGDAILSNSQVLESFLFAELGEEGGRAPLTTMSLLARSGIDPWEQAAKLSAMPRREAEQAFAKFLATVPDSRWTKTQSDAIAERALRLLPDQHIALLSSTARTRHKTRLMRTKDPRRTNRFLLMWAVLLAISFIELATHDKESRTPQDSNNPTAATAP